MANSTKQHRRRLSLRNPSRRSLTLAAVYALLFAVALFSAFFIRNDFEFTESWWRQFFVSLPWVIAVKVAVFYSLGLCHASWRRTSFDDLTALLNASALALLVEIAIDSFVFRSGRLASASNLAIPRSVLVLDWITSIFLLGGLRTAWRSICEELLPLLRTTESKRVLVVGANHAGEMLVRNLHANASKPYLVVGFLDDDTSLHGSRVAGAPVLGAIESAEDVISWHNVAEVLVQAKKLPGKRFRALIDLASRSGAAVKVMPSIDDLITRESSSQFLVRDVEITDLLQREPVLLDEPGIRLLVKNRTVLVTGAGGSIGSEICRQLVHFGVGRILLVERSENALFFLEQELLRLSPPPAITPLIADITDTERMNEIFRDEQPEIVFHAAAHKHVPMMEKNPSEAIKNNVLGTEQLALLCDRSGVEVFVLISTDKAVHPTSVMGCTKLLAERIVQCLNAKSSTKFICVRFGNVLGSNGSVVPVFLDQIRRGGPVTVTHPDIERYFMTIPEASQLVLQAASIGNGGELFVLDMGESVRVLDMARDLIRLSGFEEDEIEIKFTGLRPGEKLFEELYFDDEEKVASSHAKVSCALHRPIEAEDLQATLNELKMCLGETAEHVRHTLRTAVPEFGKETHDSLSAQAYYTRVAANSGTTEKVPAPPRPAPTS